MSEWAYVKGHIDGDKIVMVIKPYCRHSDELMKRFKELGIDFTLIILDDTYDDPIDIKNKMRQISGRETVPQVFVYGCYIGNNSKLKNKSKTEIEEIKRNAKK